MLGTVCAYRPRGNPFRTVFYDLHHLHVPLTVSALITPNVDTSCEREPELMLVCRVPIDVPSAVD